MLSGYSKSRGKGRGKNQKVPLKGLFSDGVWHCNCDPRLPAQRFQTKNGGKNHGRWCKSPMQAIYLSHVEHLPRFPLKVKKRAWLNDPTSVVYTCQQAQPKRCDFFLWDDDAKPREAAAVLSNSRTEPVPPPPTPTKTPIGEPTIGLETPKTGSNQRYRSPDVSTPYTPSKVHSGTRSATNAQASAITRTSSDEEYFDWPASDEEALKFLDKASPGSGMALPKTPRKVARTDAVSTPGKCRHSEIDGGGTDSWPTPASGAQHDIFMTPPTSSKGNGFLAMSHGMPSPAETPTPRRFKDIPYTEQDSELTTEILNALRVSHVLVAADAKAAIKAICDKQTLTTRGIVKGRDISRAMVNTKNETIAELQETIAALQAERETNRAIIRHLRRETQRAKDREQ